MLSRSFNKHQTLTAIIKRAYSTSIEVKPAAPIKLFKVTNEATTTDDLFSSGKVVVFGVPVRF